MSKRWTKESIATAIRSFVASHGRLPHRADFRASRGMPAYHTVLYQYRPLGIGDIFMVLGLLEWYGEKHGQGAVAWQPATCYHCHQVGRHALGFGVPHLRVVCERCLEQRQRLIHTQPKRGRRPCRLL